MINNKWKNYAEEKPPSGRWIYALQDGVVQIVRIPDSNELKDIECFNCFDCGFYEHPDLTDKFKWAHINKNRFFEICPGCNAEKYRHACGKDSHPGCANYLRHEEILKTEIDNSPTAVSKRSRRRVLFFWSICVLTYLVIWASCNVSGLLEMWGKKYIYNNVAAPAISDVSKNVCNVIEAVRKPMKEKGEK